MIVPGLSVTVSATAIEDSTIDTDQWGMSGDYETALAAEVGSVLSKAHGKGERGFTGKPEFKPKPGKLSKGVRPSSTNPGQFEVKNPQTGTWVLKPSGMVAECWYGRRDHCFRGFGFYGSRML